MRKIRIIEHVSLDGVCRPAGGPKERGDDYANGGWTVPFRSADGREAVAEAHGSTFDLLLGRRTYDLFATFWPKAGDSPLANRLNAATKYVATHRPDSLGWGPVGDLGADIVEGVHNIKSREGPDLILLGSATLASLLLERGLVDEVMLVVYPLLLGRGKRFFSDEAASRELTLVSTKTTSTGVLIDCYRTVGSPRNPPTAAANR